MRIFFDTNIFLDVAQGREPFYEDSAKLIRFGHHENVQAFISWHSMATLFYILAQPWGGERAKNFLSDVLLWAELAPTSQINALRALQMEGNDFEDSLQIQCAIAAYCDLIVTRNAKDFGESTIPVLTPKEFLAQGHSFL